MNKILLGIAGLMLSLPFPSSACLNDYKSNQRNIAASRGLRADLEEVSLLEPWIDRVARLQKEVAAGGDYQVQNDLATALMHTGAVTKAIPILEEIEKGHPGLYRTASNLGTAYELAGDPVQALEWIRKGIERNPTSHESSEWIHLRILEEKVAHANDPKWEPVGSILGLDFGTTNALKAPAVLPKGNAGKTLTLAEVEQGLKYQLHERLQFVRPENPVVASLLLDYADAVALNSHAHDIGVAVLLYDLAHEYAAKESRLEERARERETVANQANLLPAPRRSWWKMWGMTMVAAFAAAGGIFVVWRRMRRRVAG